MLFLELALIRWSGANVVYLSYFTNFVLLGSFLGIGIGFLRSRAPRNSFPLAPIILLLFVLFVVAFPVQINHSGSQLIYFGGFQQTGLPVWITLPAIFLMVAAVMAAVGEGVARRFQQFESLEAYRLDILGSLAGITVFSVVSFAKGPPIIWGIIVSTCFVVLLGRALSRWAWAAIATTLVILGIGSTARSTYWSPYYKITLTPTSQAAHSPILVSVNGIPHQTIESIAQRRQSEPAYFIPYARMTSKQLNNVLVVGAGNGSDVAIALSMGARHVDAVEIDPELYQIGKRLNPDHPYQDPRVSVHITDGRAYLNNTKQKYDLILFALPDSLTLVSSQSSLRLESYLFTLQAMQVARDHLQPHGVFAMYNYYRQQWLVDRLKNTLQTAYGRTPCVDTVGQLSGGLSVLTTSPSAAAVHCQPSKTAATLTRDAPGPVNDDRPFLYLRTRTIPVTYLVMLLLITLTSLGAVRLVAGPLKQMSGYHDLFFMGAAFFLLETKSVVQFALLFGTTWFVNALVFGGVLVTVYLAVETAKRGRIGQHKLIWPLLFTSLVLNLVVPTSWLLSLPPELRFVGAGFVTFTPIFIANLIFAGRFKAAGTSTLAFGANLLGAVIGGLLEYTSIIIGYRALTGIVAVLYILALLSARRIVAARH